MCIPATGSISLRHATIEQPTSLLLITPDDNPLYLVWGNWDAGMMGEMLGLDDLDGDGDGMMGEILPLCIVPGDYCT
jgi:hypothetical protein